APRAGSVNRPQDRGPADDEKGAGDQQRVEDGSEERGGARGHPWKEQHAGDRQGHGAEKTEVREGRKRRLLSQDELVVGPNCLTQPPGKRRGADQDPGDPGSSLMTPGREAANGGGEQGRQGLAQVVEALRDRPAAPLELQPG